MDKKKLITSLIAGLLALIMILSLVIGILPTVKAASSSEIKNQLDELQKDHNDLTNKIKDLEKKLNANATEVKEMVEPKKLVEQQINLLYMQVDNMHDQIAAYSVMIADIQEDLDEAELRLKELNEKNRERIRAMEEQGELSYWSVLFEASSFMDLLDRLNMIEEIQTADRLRLKQLRAAAQLVSDTKQSLVTEKQDLQKSKESLEASQSELDEKLADVDQILVDLAAKGDEYNAWLEEMHEDKNQMMLEIANKESEYDRVKAAESLAAWLATSVPPTTAKPTVGPTTGGVAGTPVVTYPVSASGWMMPTKYILFTSRFGWRTLYGKPNYHYGIDLAGRSGWDVVASRAGIVETSVIDDPTFGNYVVIDHLDGYKSVYFHFNAPPYVQQGQFVAAGQVLGGQGRTGNATGVHLHFGIILNGTYVDPAPYLGL